MAENSRNQKKRKNNTSGFTGVVWHKRNLTWYAKIRVGSVWHRLGSFKNKEDAIKARKAAEIEYGFHKNHGR